MILSPGKETKRKYKKNRKFSGNQEDWAILAKYKFLVFEKYFYNGRKNSLIKYR